MSRIGRAPAALLLAAMICGTGPSRAAEAPPQLEYDAESVCPARTVFSELVQQRVSAASVDHVAAPPRQIEVRLLAEGSEFLGKLELVRADGSRYQREVRGPSCTEVADALAFVLALTLTAKEPAAQAAPEPSKPPEPPQPAEVPAAAMVVPPRNPEKPVEKRRSAWGYGLGLQLGARAGLTPEWALIQGAFLETHHESEGLFGFNLRAGFLRAANVEYTDLSGTTNFSWWAVRLEGCPLRLRLSKPLGLMPCAGMHIGRTTATGVPVSGMGASEGSPHTWVDALAGLRLELSVVRWLSLQAQTELLVPFTRFQFAFENPETTVYRVPAVAFGTFAAALVRFP